MGHAHAYEAVAWDTGRWSGMGHVYQGAFRSFVVQEDEHLLTVCRYVERNPVRTRLVERAEQWRWSSAGRRPGSDRLVPLIEGPVTRPADWLRWVNETESDDQVTAIRRSVVKGQPYGTETWVTRLVGQWNLQATLREPDGQEKRHKMIPDTISVASPFPWHSQPLLEAGLHIVAVSRFPNLSDRLAALPYRSAAQLPAH